MGEFRTPPDLADTLKDIKQRLQNLANAQAMRTYTVATRPAASTPQVIYVSDATSGQRFQGWDVTAGAWVPLG